MKVVADSSPLIVLSKIGCLDHLPTLYPVVYISSEVYAEVVVAGAGLPGASQVAKAEWIEVKEIQASNELSVAQQRFGLGLGELSTIIFAKEISAPIVLIDDAKGRRLAMEERLAVRGTVGILEQLFRRGAIADLRKAFERLLIERAHLDHNLLNQRLQIFGLPPLP